MSWENPTTLMDFVAWCEQNLGCRLPPGNHPDWRKRAIEVSKIRKHAEKEGDPRLADLGNLMVAGRYCKRRKIEVRSPVGVTYKIEKALLVAAVDDLDEIEMLIVEAVEVERALDDLWTESWVTRLLRSRGAARAEVLTEWQTERQVRR